MQCFQCEREAQDECPRCGALYCESHGDALCERCMDPARALPSYRVYGGSLTALLIASVFAIWLMISPPQLGDSDAPPALAGFTTDRTPTVDPEETATPTPGPAATASPGATEEPGATATPEAIETTTPGTTEYVVQPGDTLFQIADQFRPPDQTAEQFAAEIAELNGLTDWSALEVGDVLQIPAP